MCDCPRCQHQEGDNSSSFVLGVIIGLVAAAIVALVIYKNRRSDVVATLKTKLNEILSPYLPQDNVSAIIKKKTSQVKTMTKPKVESPIVSVPQRTTRPKPRVFKVSKK